VLNKIDMSNSYYQSFSISKGFVLYFEVILLRLLNLIFGFPSFGMTFMVVCVSVRFTKYCKQMLRRSKPLMQLYSFFWNWNANCIYWWFEWIRRLS